MIQTIALALDLLILAFSFGATVWFFFVQTPVLLRWKGKEKFLPIQMKLTKSLFAALAVAVPLMFGLTLVHGSEHLWLHVLTAGVAMFGALVNHFVVVPRALRAGGRALRDVRGSETDDSITDFASRGGGEESKTWHRLVVVFVVVLLGGLVAHGTVLVVGPETLHAHVSGLHHHAGHHDDHAAHAGHAGHAHDRHEHHGHEKTASGSHPVESAVPGEQLARADAPTKRNVRKLHEVVRAARENGTTDAPKVRAAFQQIFTDCKMTGADHDTLHQYLVPIAGDVEALESGDIDALGRLDKRLATFDERFE